MKPILWLFLTAACSRAQTTVSLSEALESTLREHPQIHVEEQEVLLRQGARREASGVFDPIWAGGFNQNYSPSPITTGGVTSHTSANTTSLDFGSTRLYRSGITAGPVVQVFRTRDNVVNPNGLNQGRFAYEVSVPLLRNRGSAVVAAGETSAAIEVEAERYNLSQTVSDRLAATASSYWSFAGALRFLQVAASSEQRGQSLLENVQELIRADRVPRNEINQVRANFADRSAARIAAEQDVVAARLALSLAMGLSGAEMLALGDASDDLPVAAVVSTSRETTQLYVQLALSRRADYLAAKKHVESSRPLIAAAKNQTLSSVNLTVSTGYSGLREGPYPNGLVASLFRGVGGPDAAGGIRYESARSNAAYGKLAQTEAALRQAELRMADIARAITSSVFVSVEGLRNAAARLSRSDESVAAFQTALDAERDKYRLGIGSLVDILTTEDRLTTALASQVQARLAYALGLVSLRQATGTIVEPDADAIRAPDRSVFLVPPPVGVH